MSNRPNFTVEARNGVIHPCPLCDQALANTYMSIHGHFTNAHIKRGEISREQARGIMHRINPRIFPIECGKCQMLGNAAPCDACYQKGVK